jgi:hypothetical protein
VGAAEVDPERHDADGEQCEASATPQRSSRISKVVNTLADELPTSQVTALLFVLVGRAHRAERGVSRLLGREACLQFFIDLAFQVIPNLFVEFFFQSRAADDGTKSDA